MVKKNRRAETALFMVGTSSNYTIIIIDDAPIIEFEWNRKTTALAI